MAECMTPFCIRKKTFVGGTSQDGTHHQSTVAVACGKCPACYARRVSQWSFRLMQQEKVSSSAHFITLTYETAHVHITPNGFLTLDKRDTQLFFKKLRKHPANTGRPIKYFLVGEYGGKTRRPHYHVLVFNACIESFQSAWDKGSVHYGTVSGASIGYCLKYMSKPWRPMHKNDDRVPQFALMSKGLGANYLTPAMRNWHLKDAHNRMYCNTSDNKKIAMPRYYKQKIYNEDLRKAVGVVTRQKMLIEAAKKPQISSRDLSESHLASFKLMAIKSSQNEKL